MKYKMIWDVGESKYTQDEANQKLEKVIDKLLDKLILNGNLKIGE